MDPVTARAQPVKQERNVFPYPPGFKQIQERVGCFTGKSGDEDFEVWLADFHEATADCKWTDKQGHNGFHGSCPVQPRAHGNEYFVKRKRSHGLILRVSTKDIMEFTWNRELLISAAMS